MPFFSFSHFPPWHSLLFPHLWVDSFFLSSFIGKLLFPLHSIDQLFLYFLSILESYRFLCFSLFPLPFPHCGYLFFLISSSSVDQLFSLSSSAERLLISLFPSPYQLFFTPSFLLCKSTLSLLLSLFGIKACLSLSLPLPLRDSAISLPSYLLCQSADTLSYFLYESAVSSPFFFLLRQSADSPSFPPVA